MPRYRKKDFPVYNIRRFLEPGPIVLVSSAHKDQTNIMTMGWHMVMEFSPALVTCLISGGNHSCELADAGWASKYNVFVFEVVKAHVATSPKVPKTIHYRGDGEFMISGAETRKYRKLLRPGML